MVKVNQEELQQKIAKLKEKVKATLEKAGGKYSDPEVRKARKMLKRSQRRLRVAKAYKTGGKKKAAAQSSEAAAAA